MTSIVNALAALQNHVDLNDISRPNLTPETVASSLRDQVHILDEIQQLGDDALLQAGLVMFAQSLILTGPVLAGRRRLNYATELGFSSIINNRLNDSANRAEKLAAQASDRLADGGIVAAAQAAKDDRFELGKVGVSIWSRHFQIVTLIERGGYGEELGLDFSVS